MIEHSPGRILPRTFFERSPIDVAIDLIGNTVITKKGGVRTAGRIVETEAYLGAEDLASHAARLRTGRVLVMGGPAGISYVYRSYGIHAMLNVVAHRSGETGAVLVRAIEPTDGLDVMRARRGSIPDRLLCAGPGRLCVALGITLDDHGLTVTEAGSLTIECGPSRPESDLLASGRIGISRATTEPWRFFEGDSPFVSAHRRGTPISRPAVSFVVNQRNVRPDETRENTSHDADHPPDA